MPSKPLIGCLAVAMLWTAAASAQQRREPSGGSTPATRPTTRPTARQYQLRYELSGGHENWPADKKAAIVKAMDEAVAHYNAYGEFDKTVRVSYSPGTPTADANYNGHIRFGGQIGTRTAIHEIGHTLGIGTQGRWWRMFQNGVWQGPNATALIKGFDGPDAVVRGDRQHVWPYGLNFDNEDGTVQRIRSVLLTAALRKDMGIENGTGD